MLDIHFAPGGLDRAPFEPLDGIYYWAPSRRGWEVLCWYLEPIPDETEGGRQIRYEGHLKHPNVWQDVLAYLREEWGEEIIGLLGDYYSAFPRGRVFSDNIYHGDIETKIIADAHGRVCRAFHRTPVRLRVVRDGHWDPTPEARNRLTRFLTAIGYDFQGLDGPHFRAEITLTGQQTEGIQRLEGRKGHHWIPLAQVYIDDERVLWLERMVPMDELQLDDEIPCQGLVQVEQRDGGFAVLAGRAVIDERRRQGRTKVAVWVLAGRFME